MLNIVHIQNLKSMYIFQGDDAGKHEEAGKHDETAEQVADENGQAQEIAISKHEVEMEC